METNQLQAQGPNLAPQSILEERQFSYSLSHAAKTNQIGLWSGIHPLTLHCNVSSFGYLQPWQVSKPTIHVIPTIGKLHSSSGGHLYHQGIRFVTYKVSKYTDLCWTQTLLKPVWLLQPDRTWITFTVHSFTPYRLSCMSVIFPTDCYCGDGVGGGRCIQEQKTCGGQCWLT